MPDITAGQDRSHITATPIMPLTCGNRGAGEPGPGYFRHLCGTHARGPSTQNRTVQGWRDGR
jgi:hypothetical protein